MTEDNVKASRESKHLVLDNAVHGINGIVRDLDSILNKLRGNLPEETNKNPNNAIVQPPVISPCFMDVLNASPDRIRKYCDDISQKLEELDDLLF